MESVIKKTFLHDQMTSLVILPNIQRKNNSNPAWSFLENRKRGYRPNSFYEAMFKNTKMNRINNKI